VVWVLLVFVGIVVIVGALVTWLGSEPINDYLQNVAIVTAGLGFGAGGIRQGG
jgi:hypothetical protein